MLVSRSAAQSRPLLNVARPRLRPGISVAARHVVHSMADMKGKLPLVDGGHPPFLVKAREAAHLLSISPRLLWELTNRGAIPCVRINRSVRYSIAALQMFASNATASAPAAAEGGES